MKFRSLEVTNLRAIRKLTLSNLDDLVLIAGPNGVGKSCIFDAIKLLKSAYAGYQPNELDNWFNEFQINVNRHDIDLSPVFRDPSQPLVVSAVVALDASETSYLREHAEDVLRGYLWKSHAQRTLDPEIAAGSRLAAELGPAGDEIEGRMRELLPVLEQELTKELHEAKVELSAKTPGRIEPNLVLSLVWGTFAPGAIGIIDFHSAHRSYGYERISNINLAVSDANERMRSHALYQVQNKYSNIKAEMASAYIRDLVAKEAGRKQSLEPTVIATLTELFDRFFPGKSFLGPMPSEDGSISFPVRVDSDGREHDVDFLSSGEKEVLFGYLRLRNASPRNSVILIDEPELHLNPRLVKGLPRFYNEYIGKNLNNQVWLVTHSDIFLRDSRGVPGASIWHMQAWQEGLNDDQQATLIENKSLVEAAIFDLIGDIGGYHPGAKVLIVEGADSEFDKELIQRFFPELAAELNIISAGGRSSVEKLQSLLDQATNAVGWSAKFHAITDRDIEHGFRAAAGVQIGLSQWDVYHIENYLLCPAAIYRVLSDLQRASRLDSEQAVEDELKTIARERIGSMVVIEMHSDVNRQLKALMQLRVKPAQGETVSDALSRALNDVRNDYDGILAADLGSLQLRQMERRLREKYSSSLESDAWKHEFRGRDLLLEFCSRHIKLPYGDFRSLVIARMQDMRLQPIRMRMKLEEVING